MDPGLFERTSEYAWRVAPHDGMRVPAVIFADEALLRAMDDKVLEQVANVARLPGIVKASYAMPDAHWGYGFPIGGVAAFDPEQGGVVSAGGVGFDISCGVRCMPSDLDRKTLTVRQAPLAEALYRRIPAGLGRRGELRLDDAEMDAMLAGGARWAVERGYGEAADPGRIEEGGSVAGAEVEAVSGKAKERQRAEMGTLGSGNHYLEVQYVAEVFDAAIARAFGLARDQVVVSIHCGSRGLGHQIGTEFLRDMAVEAARSRIRLPERELACAPIASPLGRTYLGAMSAAMNCALANRQIIGDLARRVFAETFPGSRLGLLFDVSHNTCKRERHEVGGRARELYVHRKGATRAFGPGHPELPEDLRAVGQPVLIGGSMGTGSYVLAGTPAGEDLAFSSGVHGAGRTMSRRQALKRWRAEDVTRELETRGILVRSPSRRGVAEEAPDAYKDVGAVVDAADRAGLARKVAHLAPLVCIKG